MNKLDFSKDIILQTDRLILRKINLDDIQDIFEYAKDEEVVKWVTWPVHKSIEDTKKYINFILDGYEKNKHLAFVAERKEDKKVIGTVGFAEFFVDHDKAEIGYTFGAKYWGKGYATEAAKKIIEFGFNELGLNRIQAYVFAQNEASKKVLKKSGMQFEGAPRQAFKKDGKYLDLELYAILKSNFEKKNL